MIWSRAALRTASAALLAAALVLGPARADDQPTPAAAPVPQVLTRQAAVLVTLQNNPELMALRQQHGIAAAAIVVAETYPFNPTWEFFVRHASGPESANVTNVVATEHAVLLEIECRHQGKYRRQEADAGLARTDWEIANQELTFAVRAARAFNTVLYRQRKLALVQESITLNEQAVAEIKRLRGTTGGPRAADLILAETEVADLRTQLNPGRLAVETALYDLYRLLGAVAGPLEVAGDLAAPLPSSLELPPLVQAALQQRPDLRARQAAVAEAEARLRLEMANRLGNMQVGPGFEYDPSRIVTAGVNCIMPLPVLNLHRGQIEAREAERARAYLDLRQTEIAVQQDVQAALARLQSARAWHDAFRTEALPGLEKSRDAIRKLWLAGEPGVDAFKVIDVQRKLIRARDAELDALYELSQAEADLAAAVADPSLAVGPCPPPPVPEAPPPPKP